MAARNQLLISILGLAGIAAYAQQGQVAGPVAGYVFDNGSHALRPVLGIPGASVLGDPLNIGTDLFSAAVSPRLDSVIAVASDRSFHVFTLNNGTATETPVNGINAAPERVIFSPTGAAAALYAQGKIQIVKGLPSAPSPAGTYDLSGLLSGPAGRGHRAFTGSFAVSDDGAYLLVAAGGGVQLFGAGAPRQVASAADAALNFAPGTHDAAVAGTSLTVLKDVAGSATPQPLGDADGAVGVAFSADASKLYTASRAGVRAFDLSAGTNSQVTCSCTPAGLSGMGSLYRLNDLGSAPLWLLDTTSSSPRIVFVPVKSTL